MLPLLLANWKAIIPSAVALALGLWLGITKLQLANVRAEYATHLLADATATAQFNAESAAKDAELADLTIKLDQAHDTAVEAIHAVEQDYAHKFAEQLRKSSRPACGAPVSASATDPNSPANTPPGSPDGLPERVGADFAKLGADANKLAATVRLCHEWAVGIGR